MLTYNQQLKIFVWQGSFDQRHAPQKAGFEWSDYGKCWFTRSPYIAYQLKDEISLKTAHNPAADALIHIHRNILSSSAQDPIIGYDLPYFPFQAAGIEQIVNQFMYGRLAVLLADDQGLGKTIEAVGVANEMGFKKILVICPASLRLNWERELEKWHTHNKGINVLITSPNVAFEFLGREKSVVTSYNLAKYVRLYNPDFIIVDESHYVKNPVSQRTKLILGNPTDDIWRGIVSNIPTLFLTGTPLPNGKPSELWPILNRCAPDVIDNLGYWDFIQKFCTYYDDGNEIKITGAKNTKELYTRLRGSGFMIRRLKKDVLKDLPPKRYKMVIFPAIGKLKSIVEKEAPFSAEEIIKNGVPEGSPLPNIRKEMGIAKAPQCIEYIRDLLIGGLHKIVVFAHHPEVVRLLEEGLSQFNPVSIIGATPVKKRQKRVDTFQENPIIRVFIGTEAAEEGWTLTTAHDVALAEPEWVPGKNEQRADRIHRIGQTERVLVHIAVVENSLDARILSSAAYKAEDSNKVLDNGV